MSFDAISYALGKRSGGGSGGGGDTPVSLSAKDVNFYDYDGTIRYAYTAEEFLALSAMPANPTHAGLTSQGWNWSFEGAQSYVRKYGACEIGQMYITDDGKTRVYIHLEEGRLSPYLGIAVNGSAVIEWGDGSTDTVEGTSTTTVISTLHNYAAAGDYVISIAVITGGVYIVASGNNRSALLRKNATSSDENYVYINAIKRVEIGEGVYISKYAFSYCRCLESLTIPMGTLFLYGGEYFSDCRSLSHVTIPESTTDFPSSIFSQSYSLESVALPERGVTNTNGLFIDCMLLKRATLPGDITNMQMEYSGCYSLSSVTIPENVTEIGNSTFSGCYGLGKLRFMPSEPPFVMSSFTFSAIPTDCIIEVPAGTLEAYTTATNYPSSSTYTYVEY